jgi:hypothetical protein
MKNSRRALLSGASMLTALALVGCGASTTTSPTTPVTSGTFAKIYAQAKVYMQDLVDGLGTACTTIGSFLPASVKTELTTLYAKLQSLNTDFQDGSKVATSSAAVATLSLIANVVNKILSALSGVSGLPITVQLILSAVTTALPFIENLFGLNVSGIASVNMTPQKALNVLSSAATLYRESGSPAVAY